MSLKNWLKTKLNNALKTDQIIEAIERLKEDKNKILLQELIANSKPGSVFSCRINEMDLLAPVEMLRLYPHCLHPQIQEKLTYFVETEQANWLFHHLRPGDTALDIGAAFGIITLALSKAVGKTGQIHAFEPSRNTQPFLQKVLELNHIENVTLVCQAISDTPGSADFLEYTQDNSLSWASDVSALASNAEPQMANYQRYGVEVTTIDDYVAATGIEPKAIKMDIEGFEFYALQGGSKTLEKFKPYLCIDIHRDVKTGESAILGIEPYLLDLKYDLRSSGHALYATPNSANY